MICFKARTLSSRVAGLCSRLFSLVSVSLASNGCAGVLVLFVFCSTTLFGPFILAWGEAGMAGRSLTRECMRGHGQTSWWPAQEHGIGTLHAHPMLAYIAVHSMSSDQCMLSCTRTLDVCVASLCGSARPASWRVSGWQAQLVGHGFEFLEVLPADCFLSS